MCDSNSRSVAWFKKGTLIVGFVMSAVAMAGDDRQIYADWLGRELTITSSPVNHEVPTGGKLTFVYDPSEKVVRLCTRTASNQNGQWQSDLAEGACKVTLEFTEGSRFCTLEDLKTGDGEVLAQCHRLRSKEVALKSEGAPGALVIKEMLVFLLNKAPASANDVAILLDAPSRVTSGPIIVASGGGK